MEGYILVQAGVVAEPVFDRRRLVEEPDFRA